MTTTSYTVRVEVVPNDSMTDPSDYGPFRSPDAAHKFADALTARLATAAVKARVKEEWGEETFLSVQVMPVTRPTLRAVLKDWRIEP